MPPTEEYKLSIGEGSSEKAARSSRIVPSPRVVGAPAYGIPRASEEVDLALDANEGPAPSSAVLDATGEMEPDVIRRYPSTRALSEILAPMWGVVPERILVTAGGDDALDRLMRAMLCEGREIVYPVPSFEMIERYARLASGTIVEVPWPGGPYPEEAVIAAINDRTSVVCVVTPNNPTGAVATIDNVRAVAAAAPHAVVLLDQAYAELADEDLTRPALRLENVVIVRSMSKAYGLAGLRIGYAIGAPEILGWMRAAGGPYAVAGPSLHLAMKQLTRSEGAIDAYLARVRIERKALFTLLSDLGYSPLPSQANFVFARVPSPVALRDAMARRGIGIRAFPGKRHLTDAVRITVPANEEDFRRVCDALSESAKEITA